MLLTERFLGTTYSETRGLDKEVERSSRPTSSAGRSFVFTILAVSNEALD